MVTSSLCDAYFKFKKNTAVSFSFHLTPFSNSCVQTGKVGNEIDGKSFLFQWNAGNFRKSTVKYTTPELQENFQYIPQESIHYCIIEVSEIWTSRGNAYPSPQWLTRTSAPHTSKNHIQVSPLEFVSTATTAVVRILAIMHRNNLEIYCFNCYFQRKT